MRGLERLSFSPREAFLMPKIMVEKSDFRLRIGVNESPVCYG